MKRLHTPVTPHDASEVSAVTPGATRRQVLSGLSGVAVAVGGGAGFARKASAASANTANADFLEISRTLTGSYDLPGNVAARIRDLLDAREVDFPERCGRLLSVMRSAGPGRDARLAALSEEEVAFALRIAAPWYVGHVGEPSAQGFDDGAEFATFLHAQGSGKIIDVVPRTTYPQRGPGWWSSPPPGVNAPTMPPTIFGWAFQPEAPGTVRAPAPQWKAYADASFATLDQARKARPDTDAGTGTNTGTNTGTDTPAGSEQ